LDPNCGFWWICTHSTSSSWTGIVSLLLVGVIMVRPQ
jgi:hypothetical protein